MNVQRAKFRSVNAVLTRTDLTSAAVPQGLFTQRDRQGNANQVILVMRTGGML